MATWTALSRRFSTWTTGPDDSWQHGGPIPAGAERISLRQDDIWLETQQYLGVVLRDAPNEEAIHALEAARRALDGKTSRQISPPRVPHYRGMIGHDLAALLLRRRFPAAFVLAELAEAEATLLHVRNSTMLASSSLTRAAALRQGATGTSSTRPVDGIEPAVWSAFEYAGLSHVLMTQVRVAIDGTNLLVGLRGALADDRARLEAAARTTVERGFPGQARKILERPQLRAAIPEFEPHLRRCLRP